MTDKWPSKGAWKAKWTPRSPRRSSSGLLRPERPWDRSYAHKTLRLLYDMMADELNIPRVRDVATHSWRATLNSEWMERGVPVESRHEFFGHSEEENLNSYTDATHTRALIDMLDGANRMTDSVRKSVIKGDSEGPQGMSFSR
ncbi:hypothetical protein VXJ25_08880 [Olsenella sp. YH-ols2223]|uniref:Tyr recombinase domain-containing protein n=2 Tax=Olsenella absiana TaxID=3115222 RepID=A0ABU7RBV9_9ACTN